MGVLLSLFPCVNSSTASVNCENPFAQQTSFKQKKRSLSFWVDCQRGFDTLKNMSNTDLSFRTVQCFINFLSDGFRQSHGNTMRYNETFDALGRKHIFDLDSPEDEKKLAQEMHQNANRLPKPFGILEGHI